VSQVKAVMDGSWKATSYWGGLQDGIVLLAPLTDNAPVAAKAKVAEMAAKIKDGSFKVFAGPLKAQDGSVKIAAGQAMSDKDMLGMGWFVEGVVGKIANK
jgi:basic membrane protein A